jgi:cytochrome P450 family 6
VWRKLGEKWKRLRKAITHAFTTGRIKMMYTLAQQQSIELINLVDRTEDEIDLKNICSRFIADVIGSVGFGIECNTLRGENAEITEITQMNDIRDDKTRAKFFFIHVFPDIAKRFKMKLTPDHIEEMFMRMTKNTYDYRMKNEVNRNDFMSFLMKIHRDGKLSDDEIESVGTITFNELAAQSFLFFSAGYDAKKYNILKTLYKIELNYLWKIVLIRFDTSSTTMQMALYELAYRPQMQTQLRNEINDILAQHDGEMTCTAITQMTFLDQIFNGERRNQHKLEI